MISIDTAAQTADVQGMCTYEHLVDETLARGFIPYVVPQLRTITLGGAVTGLGIESTSFRHGLPHESVLEMDILTPDGDVITVTPDGEHAELFRGFPDQAPAGGSELRQHHGGGLGVLPGDAEVGHQAYDAGTDRRDEHAAVARAGHEVGRVVAWHHHDVGLDGGAIEIDAGEASEAIGDERGVGVIVGETLDVVVECVQRGGGEEADLAHRAAEHASRPHGTADDVARAGQERAARSPKAFRERHGHHVERRREHRDRGL